MGHALRSVLRDVGYVRGVPRTAPQGAKVRRRRAAAVVALAVAIVVAIALASGGSDTRQPPRATRPPQPFAVGSGARAARVLPGRGAHRRATVVFLHGWGMTGPTAYDGWLRHLTSRGSTVILPRYQSNLRTYSLEVPDDAVAGVRAALRRVRPRPRRVVVIGHSVGGVLAVDYAARARQLGLPPAAAVMIVYPGGALKDMPPIPEESAAKIPASVLRLLVLASPTDQIVGTAPAEAIVAGAVAVPEDRRQLVSIDDPVAGGHFAPVLDSPAARREFWNRADQLIALLG